MTTKLHTVQASPRNILSVAHSIPPIHGRQWLSATRTRIGGSDGHFRSTLGPAQTIYSGPIWSVCVCVCGVCNKKNMRQRISSICLGVAHRPLLTRYDLTMARHSRVLGSVLVAIVPSVRHRTNEARGFASAADRALELWRRRPFKGQSANAVAAVR